MAWNRKIGAGTLLEKSGATDIQEKLLYPGAGGELKALALGSAAHQLLPLQTELLSSSASVCPEIRASSLRVTWVCLPLCLAQMNLCGAGCQECIPIPGACWGDAVAVLPTNQFGS